MPTPDQARACGEKLRAKQAERDALTDWLACLDRSSTGLQASGLVRAQLDRVLREIALLKAERDGNCQQTSRAIRYN